MTCSANVIVWQKRGFQSDFYLSTSVPSDRDNFGNFTCHVPSASACQAWHVIVGIPEGELYPPTRCLPPREINGVACYCTLYSTGL
jgi:hypothetical protein